MALTTDISTTSNRTRPQIVLCAPADLTAGMVCEARAGADGEWPDMQLLTFSVGKTTRWDAEVDFQVRVTSDKLLVKPLKDQCIAAHAGHQVRNQDVHGGQARCSKV